MGPDEYSNDRYERQIFADWHRQRQPVWWNSEKAEEVVEEKPEPAPIKPEDVEEDFFVIKTNPLR